MGGTSGTARLMPLTGMLTTLPTGGLAVRRVRVRVTSGPDRGREALLEAGTLLVGTHPQNDLVLRDPAVTENHLELALVAAGVRLRDLGSENGTTFAGSRVSTRVVPTGTELTVGRTTLQLIAADVTVPVPASERTSFGPVLGQAACTREMIALLERIAPTDVPVLVWGESGAGKTIVAKSIHAASRFAASPMVLVDFSRPVERILIEQIAQRTETFTLLLENIDRAHSSLSSALLSVYERREEGVLDARIVSTAMSPMELGPNDPRWKRELLAHIAAVRLRVPPLRERMEDIPMLVLQFLTEVCGTEARLEPGDLSRAMTREYPGNIKELKSIIVRAIAPEPAPRALLPRAGLERARAALVLPLNARPKPPSVKVARERMLEAFERDWLEREWNRADENIDALALNTGLPRDELTGMLRRHKLLSEPVPPGGKGSVTGEKKRVAR